MKITTTTKFVAGTAAAMLLLPTLAFAHDNNNNGNDSVKVTTNAGLHLGLGLGNKIEKAITRIENKNDNKGDQEQKKEDRQVKQATTTAAAIAKKAVNIQTAANAMATFSPRVGALIASSSVADKAALQTKLGVFNTDVAGANAKAAAAISGSAQVNATNSTTTNASLLAQAKLDVKAAADFLNQARENLFSILSALWK